MKLNINLLKRLIDLPSDDTVQTAELLDDLGLEVKGITESEQGTVFTIETLANRGDHLSALGIAREISSRNLTPIHIPAMVQELPSKSPTVILRLETEKCLKYGLLEIALGRNFAVSDEIKSICGPSDKPPIVDCLNYLQAEIGQPMHAFDRDKIDGEIRVVLSNHEEKVLALDGCEYVVPAGSIVICDRKKTVAVAGVIGLENSKVTEATTKVLIECATFDPVSIRLTARAMGISTEASYAFERGTDEGAIVDSLKRLGSVIQGGRGSVSSSEGAHLLGFNMLATRPVERRLINLDPKIIRTAMNRSKIGEVEVKSRLKNLGYSVTEVGKNFEVIVPSWRLWDVFDETDLVEDFVRAAGFNTVKLAMPPLDINIGELTPIEQLQETYEPVLLGSGFYEVITESLYSAVDVSMLAQYDETLAKSHIEIVNALERDCSHLRATNLVSYARLILQNARKGVSSIKVFEQCRLYGVTGRNKAIGSHPYGYEFEREVLTLAMAGRWYENDFRKAEDFEQRLALFKGVIESLIASFTLQPIAIARGEDGLLHPGRQARIIIDNSELGFFGEIHPGLAKSLGLKEGFLYAELDVDSLIKIRRPGFVPKLSELPSVWRDITVKVEPQGIAGETVQAIHKIKPDNLSCVSIIDDFRKSEEDFRRVSLRLIFQNISRTLSGSEVDSTMSEIVAKLNSKFKIELAN